jgi:hypothetical protein
MCGYWIHAAAAEKSAENVKDYIRLNQDGAPDWINQVIISNFKFGSMQSVIDYWTNRIYSNRISLDEYIKKFNL